MKKISEGLKNLWKDKPLILMATPAVIILILFNYIPMTGLVLAFKKFDYSLGMYKSPWRGFQNFKQLFLVGETFWRITRNTVGYYILFTAVGVIFEVGLAMAINELAFKRIGKYLHSVMIMPTFVSAVALTYIVNAFLNKGKGMLNQLIESLGGNRIDFYIEAGWWPLILTIVKLWCTVGYGSVLYLSALAGIDPELYDSASLDGANARQRMRYITIPMLIPTVCVKVFLSLGSMMHSDTGLFYQVTKNIGALYPTTQVMDSYILNSVMQASQSDFGVTAATTFYQSVIGFIMVVLVNKLMRKISPENALF